MLEPTAWPKLILRILALNVVALPGAFLAVCALSIIYVIAPHKHQEYDEVAFAMFALMIIGPGLIAGQLMALNQFVTNKKFVRRTIMRAFLWGGGLMAAIAASTGLVTMRAAHIVVWLAVANLVALAAEVLEQA